MRFEVILYFYYWYFVSSWDQTGVLTFQMNSDFRDGFICPTEPRTSRSYCKFVISSR
jgi:hypothetical protein